MSFDSTTWSNGTKPVKMMFRMESAGRVQKIVAAFNEKKAEVDVDNGGAKSHVSLAIPGDGEIVDDPMSLMIGDKIVPGTKKIIYVLDPTTVSFIKNEIVFKGVVWMSLPAWFEGFAIEQCLIDEVIERIPRSLRGKVESRKVYRLDIEGRPQYVIAGSVFAASDDGSYFDASPLLPELEVNLRFEQ